MVGRQCWLVVVIGRRLTAWARHDGMKTAWDPPDLDLRGCLRLVPEGKRSRAVHLAPSAGPSAWRRRSTIARASSSVAKSHSMSLPVSESPRRASTLHRVSRMSQTSRRTSRPQAPFHHRPRTSTLAGYSYRRSIGRLSQQSCCSLVTSFDPLFVSPGQSVRRRPYVAVTSESRPAPRRLGRDHLGRLLSGLLSSVLAINRARCSDTPAQVRRADMGCRPKGRQRLHQATSATSSLLATCAVPPSITHRT
jgi:hypothetical protein